MEKIDKQAVGARIRAIRLDRGMTTKEFGKLFNTNDSTVSSWEKGRTKPNPELSPGPIARSKAVYVRYHLLEL